MANDSSEDGTSQGRSILGKIITGLGDFATGVTDAIAISAFVPHARAGAKIAEVDGLNLKGIESELKAIESETTIDIEQLPTAVKGTRFEVTDASHEPKSPTPIAPNVEGLPEHNRGKVGKIIT